MIDRSRWCERRTAWTASAISKGHTEVPAVVDPNSLDTGAERQAGRRLHGVNDAATLAWLGNQAALEFHPAPVRRDRIERPDLLVVDIDPPDDAFGAAVDVAFLVLDVLDDMGMTTLVKTTGGKGLHIVVPIVRHVSPNSSDTPPRGSPRSSPTAGPTS